MVTEKIENLLAKISEVVDQSKTSYMHQNKPEWKIVWFAQKKTFLGNGCYGNQRKSIFVGYGLQKLRKMIS